MPKKPPPQDPLISSVDVAALLGVTSKHALTLMRDGHFGPMFDVGTGDQRGRPRVHRSAVLAWLETRRYTAEASA